jgi:hypothetical protein
MKRRAIFISFLIIIALSPIIVSPGEQNYFYALKKGNIYKEKDVHSEIVEKYIEEESFLFSYEKAGWVCLWRTDSKKGFQKIGYTLEENGTIVNYDRLLQLAEESNRKYDKPEAIRPRRELSLSAEEIKKLITNNEVRIGMTAEQVIRLCGKPNRINESVILFPSSSPFCISSSRLVRLFLNDLFFFTISIDHRFGMGYFHLFQGFFHPSHIPIT